MRPFTDFKVWQIAHELTLEIYRLTRTFPSDERFGLTAQLRRAASSVGANIAEGSMSRHPAEFARILNIAEREAAETACHLILARDLGYLAAARADELSVRVTDLRRRLSALRQRVEGQRSFPPRGDRKPASRC